jgi:Pvc16 N-terminal domain
MSNSLAIAAVTATLRSMLQTAIQPLSPGAQVTARPLDRAREGMTVDSVNLFLYNTGVDAAWRNADMPGVNPGELAATPLALILSYLVTSYSQTDDDVVSHRLLGGAMGTLNDHPVLDPVSIEAALPGNDLYLQVEQVKVTPSSLDIEEISKLWTAFQTNYRISAAYSVSAVLIQSSTPPVAPLPVLTRGSGDQGPAVQGSVSEGVLGSVVSADGQLYPRLGGVISLGGEGLAGTSVAVRLTNQLLAITRTVPATSATSTSASVQLPNNPASFPAGMWMVQAVISSAGQPDWVTNELAFGLAPQVTNLPLTATRDGSGKATVVLDCSPHVWQTQECTLLLGSASFPLTSARTAPLSSVRFEVTGLGPGRYPARLRVDGVDSLLVNASVTPPVYDTSQLVTIQ